MGSTHTCKQTAYSVIGKDSQVYFFLVESTFEANCFPRTPHAGVSFFGTAAECMHRVICYSSDCEGGMLKGARGWIKPEAYVEKWRIALRNAIRIDPEKVMLKFDFSASFYAIDQAHRAGIEQLLVDAGIDQEEARMTKGEGYNVPLISVISIFPRILSLGISAWRFLDVHTLAYAETGEKFGYSVRKNRAIPNTDNLCIAKFPAASDEQGHETNYLLFRRDTRAWDLGWRYSTVGSLIAHEVNAAEAQCPGSAEHATEFFRTLVKSAPLLDGKTLMRVLKPVDVKENSWQARYFDELTAALGRNGDILEFRLSELVLSDGIVRTLRGMGKEMLTLLEAHPALDVGQLQPDRTDSAQQSLRESDALVS